MTTEEKTRAAARAWIDRALIANHYYHQAHQEVPEFLAICTEAVMDAVRAKGEYEAVHVWNEIRKTDDALAALAAMKRRAADVPEVPLQARARLQHGVSCNKQEHHIQEDYLHRLDDDGAYFVDGVRYCGRCHVWLPEPPR